MKTDPAYPVAPMSSKTGISKLEYFACENHTQLLKFVRAKLMTSKDAAKLSIEHAEALIKELDKVLV